VPSEVRRLPIESRDEARWGLCEISWSRSYRSGAFVAIQQGDPSEEIGRSPKFRWRERGTAPPESPETGSCLETLERALAVAGWEAFDGSSGEWCTRQFRRRLVPLAERVSAYGVTLDEGMIAWLSAQTAPAAHTANDARGEDPSRVVAIREAARRRELKQLEAERLEAERRRAERREADRREADRLLARHREFERLEAERREQERLEARRRTNEHIEAERLLAEQRERERLQAERPESWTLRDRLGASAAKVEPELEIRASFGVKATPRIR
jgi:hypothetical protein